MRTGYAAIAVLAACGFQHGTAIDDAQMIDASRVDAAVVDSAMIDAKSDAAFDAPATPADSDGDGIVDTLDNCPAVANADQRNHDGDPFGDACDKCPHLASATDPDGDSDGVGDACDPRPTTAGDSRVLFEGFYDASSIQNWTANGGTWSVANGVLTQSSSTASNNTNTLSPPITVTRAAVTAGVHVITLGNDGLGTADDPHVSVASGVANNQSYWCSVVDEGNKDMVYATTLKGIQQDFPNTDWKGTFANGSDVRLNLALLGTHNVCTVVQGATTATIQGDIGPTSGGVQVATRSASASFDYVFVVSIGN